MRRGERTLFSSLSFQVQPGEVWVVTGPSGCGKSTLLHILGQHFLPTQGEVIRSGALAEFPQELALNDHLTVKQNALLTSLKGLSLWESLKAIFQGKLKVSPHDWGLRNLHQLTSELSGGEKQRLALVRSLNENWNILLADEPIAHLDDANADRMLAALKNEAIQRKGALFLVLHHEEFTKKYATHRLRLEEGRVEKL